MSKWDDHRDDLTSKDDFDKAAKGTPDEPAKDEDKTKSQSYSDHDAPGKGPKPPGGHAPTNTAWDRHDQDKAQDGPSKDSEVKRKDENNLTDTYNKNARR